MDYTGEQMRLAVSVESTTYNIVMAAWLSVAILCAHLPSLCAHRYGYVLRRSRHMGSGHARYSTLFTTIARSTGNERFRFK